MGNHAVPLGFFLHSVNVILSPIAKFKYKSEKAQNSDFRRFGVRARLRNGCGAPPRDKGAGNDDVYRVATRFFRARRRSNFSSRRRQSGRRRHARGAYAIVQGVSRNLFLAI